MKTFYITVPEYAAEVAADRLWQLGVEAVGVEDPDAGVVALWTSIGESQEALDRAVGSLDTGWTWRVEEALEADETWRNYAQPTWYDPLGVVVPAWQMNTFDIANGIPDEIAGERAGKIAGRAADTEPDRFAGEAAAETKGGAADEVAGGAADETADELTDGVAADLAGGVAADLAGGVLVTAIEPATSFGLGDHPTTALTLGQMVTHLRAAEVGRVLDVGCGSGVLGVVAAQMGATSIRAVDISMGAIEATSANALRNGVSNSIEVDTAPLNEVAGSFDLVLANILAPALLSLAQDLRRVTRPGGTLIISGILEESHQHVLDALQPFRVTRSASQDGWIAITLRAP